MTLFIGIAIGLSIAVALSILSMCMVAGRADRDWDRILNELDSAAPGRTCPRTPDGTCPPIPFPSGDTNTEFHIATRFH